MPDIFTLDFAGAFWRLESYIYFILISISFSLIWLENNRYAALYMRLSRIYAADSA
jgi:hypothetical protein